jgi:hypothetical protein
MLTGAVHEQRHKNKGKNTGDLAERQKADAADDVGQGSHPYVSHAAEQSDDDDGKQSGQLPGRFQAGPLQHGEIQVFIKTVCKSGAFHRQHNAHQYTDDEKQQQVFGNGIFADLIFFH